MLLYIVSKHYEEENNFLQRTAIFLLDSLASRVDTEKKVLMGSLGAMEIMIDLANLKLELKV